MAKTIPLTQGMVATVDDCDYAVLASRKWYAKRKRHKFYANRKIGPRNIEMHREILGVTDGGFEVHHLNGDGLDNRRANLQVLTKKEHSLLHGHFAPALQGNPTPPVGASKFYGVQYDPVARSSYGIESPRAKPWRARIRLGKKRISLGYFKTEHEAAHAFDVAALQYRGKEARTNGRSHPRRVAA